MSSYLVTFSPFLRKAQTIFWLFVLIVLFIVSLVLFIYAKTLPHNDESEMTAIEKSVASLEAVEVNEHIKKLNDLSYDVAPVEFQTIIRDLRDYPVEFKDKLYIDTYKRKWTLQVMDVAKHEIILDYLNRRADRDMFAYFRYSDRNNQSRFILTYGKVNSSDEAKALLQEVDFALPDNIKVIVKDMKSYSSMIDNYERKVTVLDMSQNRPRRVNLVKTKHLLPAPQYKKPKPKVSEEEMVKTGLPIVSDSPDTAVKILTLPNKLKSLLSDETPTVPKVAKEPQTEQISEAVKIIKENELKIPEVDTQPKIEDDTIIKLPSKPSVAKVEKVAKISKASDDNNVEKLQLPVQEKVARDQPVVFTEPDVSDDSNGDSESSTVDESMAEQFEPVNNNAIINDSYSADDEQDQSSDNETTEEPFIPNDEPILD